MLARQVRGHKGEKSRDLSSPHRGIALRVMLASQGISTPRVQIAMNMYRITKLILCDAHRAARTACFGPISSLETARFTSWVAKAHHVSDLHRASW